MTQSTARAAIASMPRHRPYALVALIFVALLALTILGRGTAAAGTPTPTATATATPLPPGTLRIVVFNDVNGDGLRDPDEPGFPNRRIFQGCGDAFVTLTTDANGEAFAETAFETCFHLTREFGWLPTRNGVDVRVPAGWDTREPFLFGFHDLGRTVMELRGEAIAGGLPMEQGVPGIEEPFRSCGHLWVESVSPVSTNTAVIVEGADTRAGCPRPGDLVVPSSHGVPQTPSPSVPFAPGTTVTTSWVDNGDSMRFYASYVSDAWVLDPATATVTKHCATVLKMTGGGLTPPGLARVFVVSEQARPGCGAPGRTVRLFRDGQPLDPILEWRAGDVSQTLPDFELAPTTMSFPDTGAAGAPGTHRHRESAGRAAIAAFAIGTLMLCAAASRRRRLPRF